MAQSALAFVPTLSIINGKPTTTSNEVAQHFGKRHDHVIEKITALIAETPEYFNAPNFRVVEYLDAKGEKRPAYRLTRDGFTLLAMGFTGKRALAFKLAYIDAFNSMEAQMHQPQPTASLEQTVADLAHQLGSSNSYPVDAFLPLLHAMLRRMGLTLAAPLQPDTIRVSRQHVADLHRDLGRLQARVDALAMPASDLPTRWWQANTVPKHN